MIWRVTATCILWLVMSAMSNLQSQTLQWISFDSIEQVMQIQPRPMMVFISTDWCKICALQEETTYKDSTIINILSEKFYSLKLNAAETESITFLRRTYRYKPSGVSEGVHELAEMLASSKGSVVFPTTTFMNAQFEVAYAHPGFMSIKDLMHIQEQLIR